MSVVVRMEMPQNCWVCPFGIDGYIGDENDARTHYVRFCSRHSGEEFHVLETDIIDRPWFCDSFICQLPENHGRLVDADAIIAVMDKCAETPEDDIAKLCYSYTSRILKESLSIVPAERSET